jgi:ribosomal protein S18 acetylase RimI-like enzyme
VLAIRDLKDDETQLAVGVLARGMRDNPLHVAAFGDDAQTRERSLARMFGAMFRVFSQQRPICALENDMLVAVTGVLAPGTCQATALQRLRMLPTIFAMGPRAGQRLAKWLDAWARHDPDRSHSHLGPLAVDAHLQRRGIGGRLLSEHTARLDSAGQASYLETDKHENVAFYERHGYVVTGQADVIGVPNWFMLREPQKQATSPAG